MSKKKNRPNAKWNAIISPSAWTIWTFDHSTQDVDANQIKQYKICIGCSSVQTTSEISSNSRPKELCKKTGECARPCDITTSPMPLVQWLADSHHTQATQVQVPGLVYGQFIFMLIWRLSPSIKMMGCDGSNALTSK